MKLPRVLVPVAALTALAACETAAPPPARTAAVTGSVTYRERILLAPPARVTVTLSDVSLMDAPSKTIATQTIDGVQSGPVNFRLDYDPARIVPNHDYAVSADAGGHGRRGGDAVAVRTAPRRQLFSR